MFIHGVGINDLHGVLRDQQYRTWSDMIRRCYSVKRQANHSTYLQCTVDPDWLFFSVFREWLQTQPWEGRDLDKDIMHPGNKHYAPDTCCFVTHAVNNLMTDRKAKRGRYPQGVCWAEKDQRFKADISINGKKKYLGNFRSPEEARAAYCLVKADYILEVAARDHGTPSDAHIYRALVRHADAFRAISSVPTSSVL